MDTKQNYQGVDIQDIDKDLQAVGDLKPKNARSAKFIYAVNRNHDKVKSILRSLERSKTPPSEKFLEYQSKRYNLALECGAEKKALPNGVTQATGIKDLDKFNAGVKALEEEYEEAFEEQKQIDKLNGEIYRNEIEEEINWHMTDYKNIPAEVPTSRRTSLMFMLREPAEEDFEEMDFTPE